MPRPVDLRHNKRTVSSEIIAGRWSAPNSWLTRPHHAPPRPTTAHQAPLRSTTPHPPRSAPHLVGLAQTAKRPTIHSMVSSGEFARSKLRTSEEPYRRTFEYKVCRARRVGCDATTPCDLRLRRSHYVIWRRGRGERGRGNSLFTRIFLPSISGDRWHAATASEAHASQH